MLVGLTIAVVSLSAAGAALAEERGGQAGSEATGQGLTQGPAGGNRQPTAEEMREMMQGVMGPMMGEMMSSMLKAMTKTMAEPQIAQNMATFARNYYQALIERGFTEEEALKIVTSTGVPSMGGKS
jgi:hypothetical protein